MGNAISWLWAVLFSRIFGGIGTAAGVFWKSVGWTAYTGAAGFVVGIVTILYWFIGFQLGPIQMVDPDGWLFKDMTWWLFWGAFVLAAALTFQTIRRMHDPGPNGFTTDEEKATAKAVMAWVWLIILPIVWLMTAYPTIDRDSAAAVLQAGATLSFVVLLLFLLAGGTILGLVRPLDDPNVRGDLVGDAGMAINNSVFWLMAVQFLLMELQGIEIGADASILKAALAITLIVLAARRKSRWPRILVAVYAWIFLIFQVILPVMSDTYRADGLRGWRKAACEVSYQKTRESLFYTPTIDAKVKEVEKETVLCRRGQTGSTVWEDALKEASVQFSGPTPRDALCDAAKEIRLRQIELSHGVFVEAETVRDRCLARIPKNDSLLYTLIYWLWPADHRPAVVLDATTDPVVVVPPPKGSGGKTRVITTKTATLPLLKAAPTPLLVQPPAPFPSGMPPQPLSEKRCGTPECLAAEQGVADFQEKYPPKK